ncbi:hypothetical protein IGI73_002817 [Enterococcus sp. DIV0755f]|uniref:GNAT family N-acetyltransferase n=1 Tax=Enterococcus TaxID=1350 RepID=UPI003D0DB090
MALVIEQGNEQELAALESALTAYTKHQKPFTQTETYQSFSCVIKKEGMVIAGGIGYASMYHIGYLDILWVKASERGKGYGKQILTALEQQLKALAVKIVRRQPLIFKRLIFISDWAMMKLGESPIRKIS